MPGGTGRRRRGPRRPPHRLRRDRPSGSRRQDSGTPAAHGAMPGGTGRRRGGPGRPPHGLGGERPRGSRRKDPGTPAAGGGRGGESVDHDVVAAGDEPVDARRSDEAGAPVTSTRISGSSRLAD